MSSCAHIDNEEKYILIFGEVVTQGLDDTTLTAEAKYPINSTQLGKKNPHYNEGNSFLFGNAKKIYQLKANDSKMKNYALCLGNIWRDFTINNMKKKKKKNRIKRSYKLFTVDFNPIDTNDILDIHRYSMKRTWYIIFGIIKKIFIVLLTSILNASSHTKCVSLSNQKCMI